jgi:hypothetical protein
MFLRQACTLLALLSVSFYLSANEATPGDSTMPNAIWVEVNPQNGLISITHGYSRRTSPADGRLAL